MEKKDKYYSYIESRILKAYYKVSNVVGFVPICIRQHNRKINNLTIHLKVKYLYKNISSVVVFRVVYLCRRYGKNLSRFEQQKKVPLNVEETYRRQPSFRNCFMLSTFYKHTQSNLKILIC